MTITGDVLGQARDEFCTVEFLLPSPCNEASHTSIKQTPPSFLTLWVTVPYFLRISTVLRATPANAVLNE